MDSGSDSRWRLLNSPLHRNTLNPPLHMEQLPLKNSLKISWTTPKRGRMRESPHECWYDSLGHKLSLNPSPGMVTHSRDGIQNSELLRAQQGSKDGGALGFCMEEASACLRGRHPIWHTFGEPAGVVSRNGHLCYLPPPSSSWQVPLFIYLFLSEDSEFKIIGQPILSQYKGLLSHLLFY